MKKIIVVSLLALFTLSLSACDWSAMWDLRRAEKMLKRADKANSEFWAEPEYHKAQKYFEEAMELAKIGKVNEARDKCALAYDWAEEAEMWAIRRAAEMERERESLNSKKY
ncbi:hypothetical protein ACFLQV_04590 [Calditrichota bacterium]